MNYSQDVGTSVNYSSFSSDEEYQAAREQQDANKTVFLEKLGKELSKRGIQISISGCGCCGSPTVKLTLDGVSVVDDGKWGVDNFNFSNFPDG